MFCITSYAIPHQCFVKGSYKKTKNSRSNKLLKKKTKTLLSFSQLKIYKEKHKVKINKKSSTINSLLSMFIFLCFLRLQFWFDLPMARFSATCQRNRICVRFLSLFVAILASRIGSCYVIGSQNNRIIFIVTEGMQGSWRTSTSSGKTGQIRPQLPWTTFSLLNFWRILFMVIRIVVHAIALSCRRKIWCRRRRRELASIKVSTIGWSTWSWKPRGRGQGWCTIDLCRSIMKSIKVRKVFIVSLWKGWTPP